MTQYTDGVIICKRKTMDSDSENVYQENLEYLSSLEDATDDLNLDLDPLASGRLICIRIIWYSKRNFDAFIPS